MVPRHTQKKMSLLQFALIGGAFLFFPQVFSLNPPPSTLNFPVFTSDALEDADLDVRDAQNRPVRARGPHQVLKAVFVSSVIDLIAVRDLPIVSQGRKILNSLTEPFRRFWTRAGRWFVNGAEFAVLFNFKRGVEKLALYLVALFIPFLSAWAAVGLRRFCPFHTCQVIPIPIRC